MNLVPLTLVSWGQTCELCNERIAKGPAKGIRYNGKSVSERGQNVYFHEACLEDKVIYRYYCIVCKFIVHTTEPWVAKTFTCPSCRTQVETREYVEQAEAEKPTVN